MDRNKLLRLAWTHDLPATTDRFVAKEKFVIGVGPEAPVKIWRINTDFANWFLGGDGVVEEPIPPRTLHCTELWGEDYIPPITIANEWGGEGQAETPLAVVYLLMKMQGKCENGTLLTNDNSNSFFVRDKDGVLRLVRIAGHHFGSEAGWRIYAYGGIELPLKLTRFQLYFFCKPQRDC